MNIRTTIHLDSTTAKSLDNEAKKRGLTRSEFVIFLAHQLMPKYRKKAFENNSVKYQKQISAGVWENLHVTLDITNYCFLVEMRCFYKISVSYLIALALKDELDFQKLKICGNDNNKILDNYRFTNRFIMYTKAKTYIKWQLYWHRLAKKKTI
ncbi:MAG: ribbon-helix-helix domain-containing protein [Spirochaetes bacterium]|nr:ribbon-helix-helix domain-containing protein [Spirochaetota bacterium]